MVIAGRAGLLQIFHHLAVPHVVGEAGGVGHEMAQRDRVLRRPQFRLAIGVEAFSTCGAARSGSTLPIGASSESLPCSTSCMPAAAVIALVIEAIQNTLSDGHGVVLGQVALAERALIDHLLAGRGHRDHAGNFFGVAFLAQHLIDLELCFAWVTSRLFFEAGRSSSRRLAPQAGAAGCGAMVAIS